MFWQRCCSAHCRRCKRSTPRKPVQGPVTPAQVTPVPATRPSTVAARVRILPSAQAVRNRGEAAMRCLASARMPMTSIRASPCSRTDARATRWTQSDKLKASSLADREESTPPGVFRVRSIEPNGAKHCQRADQSAGIVGATRRRASSFRLRAAPARRCDRHGWTHGARNGQIRNRIWPSDYGSPDRQPDHRESRNQRNERWSSGREFSGHRRTGQNGRRH